MILRTEFMICVILSLYCETKAVKVIGQNVEAKAKTDVNLSCKLIGTGEPVTSITWQRRTQKNSRITDIFVLTSVGKEDNLLKDRLNFIGNLAQLDGSILLRNVTLLDEGVYTCIFNIFPSEPFETEINLNVVAPPVVSIGTDMIPVAGDTDSILATCTAAEAKPAAEISWSVGALTDSVRVHTNISMDPDGTYSVKSYLIGVASKALDQQKVQCLIKHTAMNKQLVLHYSLIVYYPPQGVYIVSAGSHQEKHSFQCEAEANPRASNFTWSRTFPVTQTLSSNVNGNSLSIQRTPKSNGLYYCVASNQYGYATGSFYVDVHMDLTESKTCWVLFSLVSVEVVVMVVGILYIWKWREIRCGKFLASAPPSSSVRDQQRRGAGTKPEYKTIKGV